MSSEAFAPPSVDPSAADPVVLAAAVVLSMLGAFNLLFGAALGPCYFAMFTLDPTFAHDPELRMVGAGVSVVIGLVTLVFGFAYAMVHLAVAVALVRGRTWGWYGGLVLGAMYVPSCFLPASVLVMYAMLRPATRQRFLGW